MWVTRIDHPGEYPGRYYLKSSRYIPMGDKYQIQRDDGVKDGIAGQVFASYDEAYAVAERYYADICCSDDREYYRIVLVAGSGSGT